LTIQVRILDSQSTGLFIRLFNLCVRFGPANRRLNVHILLRIFMPAICVGQNYPQRWDQPCVRRSRRWSWARFLARCTGLRLVWWPPWLQCYVRFESIDTSQSVGFHFRWSFELQRPFWALASRSMCCSFRTHSRSCR